jgi:arylsulfatase A-like enzyme
MAYLARTPLAPADYGLRSAFDVVPTVVDLLGEKKPSPMTGTSLLARAAAPLSAAAE